MTREQIEKVMMEELGSKEAQEMWQASLDEMTESERNASLEIFGHLETEDEVREQVREMVKRFEPLFMLSQMLDLDEHQFKGLLDAVLGDDDDETVTVDDISQINDDNFADNGHEYPWHDDLSQALDNNFTELFLREDDDVIKAKD